MAADESFQLTRTQRQVGAEFVGTGFLLTAVVGSGIMAEQLAGGNVAVALLGNTIPTGAMLFVLIAALGPVSGAHFNPAMTLVMWLKREITIKIAVLYVLAQIFGGVVGVWVTHLMFEMPVLQFSTKTRAGASQGLAEIVAAFGLVFFILAVRARRVEIVAATVALYITGAYWFTASTSFANPAVTIARMLSDSFAGIRPFDAPMFIGAQLVGAVLAMGIGSLLFVSEKD